VLKRIEKLYDFRPVIQRIGGRRCLPNALITRIGIRNLKQDRHQLLERSATLELSLQATRHIANAAECLPPVDEEGEPYGYEKGGVLY
jgi:hypothetical protein